MNAGQWTPTPADLQVKPMSDQTIPGFVGAADLIAQADATEKWLKTEAKRSRRSRNGWRAYSLMVTSLTRDEPHWR